MTDEEIRARRAGDPNFPEIDWENTPVVIVEPVIKRPVSIRLDSDVIEFFKDAGKGYQTRINQILRAYMEHQQKKAG
ncbi:MAG: BrnA antitoxin family protein [Hyphomonas sp.]